MSLEEAKYLICAFLSTQKIGDKFTAKDVRNITSIPSKYFTNILWNFEKLGILSKKRTAFLQYRKDLIICDEFKKEINIFFPSHPQSIYENFRSKFLNKPSFSLNNYQLIKKERLKYCRSCKKQKPLNNFKKETHRHCKKCKELKTEALKRKHLHTRYIKTLLTHNSGLGFEDIPKSLVQLKRQQLKAKRLVIKTKKGEN